MKRTWFDFKSGIIEDKPEAILAEIEKCLEELQKFKGHLVVLRLPLTVMREKDFDSGKSVARVVCRLSGIHKPADFESYLEEELFVLGTKL